MAVPMQKVMALSQLTGDDPRPENALGERGYCHLLRADKDVHRCGQYHRDGDADHHHPVEIFDEGAKAPSLYEDAERGDDERGEQHRYPVIHAEADDEGVREVAGYHVDGAVGQVEYGEHVEEEGEAVV